MTATLTITGGPQRGRVFQLEDEMVHVGRGAGSGIRLSDPDLPEHQASIVRRNGRYAIYVLVANTVEVDGSGVPAERWVWLPETARLRLSRHTTLAFDARAASTAESEAAADDTPPPRDPKTIAPPAKRTGKPKRQVARFITDRPGDALVTLGEDGHLPELALVEQTDRRRDRSDGRESSPTGAYLAVAASMLMSLILLLLPDGTGGPTARDQAQARRRIEEFYERRDGELASWQRLLREARLAHTRGDDDAERRAYRRVLELLNAEEYHRPGRPAATALPSLTGDVGGDQELRELIAVMLAE